LNIKVDINAADDEDEKLINQLEELDSILQTFPKQIRKNQGCS
jgi:hypothetical protein